MTISYFDTSGEMTG